MPLAVKLRYETGMVVQCRNCGSQCEVLVNKAPGEQRRKAILVLVDPDQNFGFERIDHFYDDAPNRSGRLPFQSLNPPSR